MGISSGKTREMNDKEHHPKEMDKEIPKLGQSKHSRHNKEKEHSQHQIQNVQDASKQDDNKGENWRLDLTKSLNQHLKRLSDLDAAVETFIGRYITENTVNNDGDTTQAEGEKTRLVEGEEDIQMPIKASCESISKPLKDSFKTLHSDIDKSLERFGKGRIVIDIQQPKTRSKKVHKEVETGNSEVRKLEEEVRQLKQDAFKHKNEIKELQKQIRKLTSKLEHYRSKKGPATIQLFYLHDGNTIKDIEKELKDMMANKLGNIRFQTRKHASEIDPNNLVIVLYIVTKRVGADAANAIKDIKDPENTILMLIHYKNVHSLSSERSSDVPSDEKFRNLRGILDLAFMTDSGFFHCKMNENGIDALCALCRQRSGGDRL